MNDQSKEGIEEWMINMAPFADSALLLARAAREHFGASFHINYEDIARRIFENVRPEA
jgi:hypothetical protein